MAAPTWGQGKAGDGDPYADLETDSQMTQFKKKTLENCPWLDYGFQLRIRGIWEKNVRVPGNDSLRTDAPGNEMVWQRYRTRAWATVTPIENIEAKIGLAWEFYNWCRPEGPASPDGLRHTDLDEVAFETLYVKWSNAFDLPLSFKVGRQNLLDLNDWLLFEGTPGDGSRTAYFDAVRATYAHEAWKTTFDAVLTWNTPESDWHLTPINNRDKVLLENEEIAAILYAKNRWFEGHELHGYVMWRTTNEYQNDEGQTIRMLGHEGWDSDMTTFGARAQGDLSENWKYYGELALQVGHKNDSHVCAFGANSRLEYLFNDPLNNRVRAGYEYRSGGSNPDENFDILWGRCFQCLNIYQGTVDRTEDNAALFSNMHRFNVGWSIDPLEGLSWHNDYHLILRDDNLADELNPVGLTQFDGGCVKGHIFTSQLAYKFNENWSGHLIGEVLLPGDYYADRNNDTAWFLRYQILFTF
jgi:hypothetical protein